MIIVGSPYCIGDYSGSMSTRQGNGMNKHDKKKARQGQGQTRTSPQENGTNKARPGQNKMRAEKARQISDHLDEG